MIDGKTADLFRTESSHRKRYPMSTSRRTLPHYNFIRSCISSQKDQTKGKVRASMINSYDLTSGDRILSPNQHNGLISMRTNSWKADVRMHPSYRLSTPAPKLWETNNRSAFSGKSDAKARSGGIKVLPADHSGKSLDPINFCEAQHPTLTDVCGLERDNNFAVHTHKSSEAPSRRGNMER
jgi:hypothetical protein